MKEVKKKRILELKNTKIKNAIDGQSAEWTGQRKEALKLKIEQ